ncbi:MAG: hypothetical protein QXQ46_04390 [Thermoplasmatales archaeon]
MNKSVQNKNMPENPIEDQFKLLVDLVESAVPKEKIEEEEKSLIEDPATGNIVVYADTDSHKFNVPHETKLSDAEARRHLSETHTPTAKWFLSHPDYSGITVERGINCIMLAGQCDREKANEIMLTWVNEDSIRIDNELLSFG